MFSILFLRNHAKLRIKTAEIEKKILVIQELNDTISEKNRESELAKLTLRNAISSKNETLDRLLQTIYSARLASGNGKRKLEQSINSFLQEFTSDEKTSELEHLLDKYDKGIMRRFREAMPDLKQVDYKLFLYSALGFSSVVICQLLDEEKIEAVYNRKYRLKAKIKECAPEAASVFLSHLD